MSGIINIKRRAEKTLNCNEVLFKQVVKTAFNQRRKTMRNSLKQMLTHNPAILQNDVFNLRPEQLSVKDFEGLTNLIEQSHER
jgi:16S rRNA (adenine1518-N6/adenine1519-N6)-dimethyltransferase